ncbi:hypothetical protein B0J17DRAFT_631403 [Rhizoctonia solani]|nr:hypothetical protein B0J17DRAFT_631403 [Rhizoctonia solani]
MLTNGYPSSESAIPSCATRQFSITGAQIRGGVPATYPRYRIPYLPGPTLEDEKRAIEAQNNLPIATNNNALRPCAPVIRAPAIGESINRDKMYEYHPVPESPYESKPQTAPRRPLLEAWRTRMGLNSSTRKDAPPASRGGLLAASILDQIVVFMLLDAPPKINSRITLENFALACRRFRNGDAGVYARTGTCKFVRSLTIQFEPHDPWNPYSVLMDQMLYPTPLYTPDQIQETGIEYFFPNITQIAFVARFAPDEARTMWLASAQIFGSEFGDGNFGPQNRSKLYENPAFLAMKLVQLVPAKVKTVTLNADIPGLVAKFAVTFMARAGDPADEARLDIVTRREEVVQGTEFAIHSHVPAPTDPAPARTTIVMYGPSYGTSIIWDGTTPALPLQTVWRRYKESSKPALPEEVLPPTWEELGPGPRRSTRKSTSPYKNPGSSEDGSSPTRQRGELMSMVKSAGKIPMYAKDRVRLREPSPEPEEEQDPEPPKVPHCTPEPESIPHDQRCAWNAGQTLAEFPDAIESTFKQINESFAQFAGNTPSAERMQLEGEDAEYPEFWEFVDHLSGNQSRVGVWHTTARTEVDTFMTAYREQRFGSNMQEFKFQMLHDFREEEVVMERAVGIANMEKARQTIAARNATSTSAAGSSAGSSAANSSPEGRAQKRMRTV